MKTTKKLIRLDRIDGVLPSVQEAYDCLATVMPLVRDPEIFSVEMCRGMIEIKQPMLVQNGKGYHLISGYREWQVALYKLDEIEKIQCQIVTDASDVLLNELAWFDAYGAALYYGISPKRMGQQCNQMISKVRQEINHKFFPEFSSIRKFAKATDISQTSFYLKPTSHDAEKEPTFGDLLKGLEDGQSNQK